MSLLSPPAVTMATQASPSRRRSQTNSSGVMHLDILPPCWCSAEASVAAVKDPPEPTAYSGRPAHFRTSSTRSSIGERLAHAYVRGTASSSSEYGLPTPGCPPARK